MLEHNIYQYFWYVKCLTKNFGNISVMKQVRFAENLKRLRRENNMSQSSLAKRLGVDQRTVSAWENSVSEPCLGMLAKLCDVFDENFDSLIGE